jgi:hypothetical protein
MVKERVCVREREREREREGVIKHSDIKSFRRFI